MIIQCLHSTRALDITASHSQDIIYTNLLNVRDKSVWLGGRVVRKQDLRSTGRGFESRLPRCRVQPWASCLHTCASVTEQYNLVPANGRWCSAAGEVTAGLAESNGSLPPGLWLRSPAGWLPRTGISSGTLRSFPVWNCLCLYQAKTYVCSLRRFSILHCQCWTFRNQLFKSVIIIIILTTIKNSKHVQTRRVFNRKTCCWFSHLYTVHRQAENTSYSVRLRYID